jgi:Protein of unknown function (DUF3592)
VRPLLFSILALIAAIGSIGIGAQEYMALSKVRSVGVAAEVEPITDYTRRKSRGSETYSAEFTFTTEEGREVSKRRPFPKELLADFENGEPVIVLYDPRSPSRFVFEKESAEWTPFLMGGGFLLVSAFFFSTRKSKPAPTSRR